MYHYSEANFNCKSCADCSLNEHAKVQAELSTYIEEQAQEIAPEPEIQFIDLDGFYTYEAQVAGQVIATITHDCADFVTQPWVVMVGEVEVHRADTWAKCADYIRWHYKQGTLPKLRTTSLEELLDKPFDELSKLDWQRLKEYEPHNSAELLAA